jgi:hypothetical protein
MIESTTREEGTTPSDRERLNALIDRIYEGYAEELKRATDRESEALEARTRARWSSWQIQTWSPTSTTKSR